MTVSALITSRFTTLLSLALVLGACQKEKSEPQESTGPLEGVWKVRNVDPVTYDRQDKVVATYAPIETVGFSQLTITSTDFQYFDAVTNWRFATPYTRLGEQLNCTPPQRSYTVRKLTDKVLDLYLRGEYWQYGNQETRDDYTIHLDRQ